MPSEPTLLGIPTSLLVQVATAFLVLFWGWSEARKHYKATKEQLKPNPIVQGMTMAWDRDMHERFLQLIERMAVASEAQAKVQESLANAQTREMNETMEKLLASLEKKERTLSAMRVRARQTRST